MQEGPPSLAGWPSPFDHVLGNARLRDLKPKLEQFAVDAWRTPKLVLRAHLPDQRAQFHLDSRAALPAGLISNANSDESRPDAPDPAVPGVDPSPCSAKRSADVGAPHSPPQACSSTRTARPARPEQTRSARLS